jgi:glycine/D-amino acid oxidase-like deaminating enzyme
MDQDELFSPDFESRSYWLDICEQVEVPSRELPAEADVIVIGAGYTGLNAALQTAREGLSTLVVDAGTAGSGCSMRNGGQVSTSIKPGYETLKRRYGDAVAVALFQEGQASLDYLKQLDRDEGLDCGLREVGRFHGAHLPKFYAKLAGECEAPHKVLKTDAYMVPKSEMASELGTDAYHGGIVYPHHCSINVGKYHPTLLARVLAANALVMENCPAVSIEREANGFLVTTAMGRVRAEKVIVATNGYSGALSPYHRRRIIPIGSYVIATEEIAPPLVDRLFPTERIISDTRKLVYYYRLSPDRRRVVFGGRVSLRETDAQRSAVKLHRSMTELFPELAHVRISRSWYGFVGYTFDTLAHCGEDRGLYYAMGYCGSGVGMASYLGMRMGLKAAGREKTPSAFERIPFPTRPLYQGNPWFLAPSILVYRLRDRFGI